MVGSSVVEVLAVVGVGMVLGVGGSDGFEVVFEDVVEVVGSVSCPSLVLACLLPGLGIPLTTDSPRHRPLASVGAPVGLNPDP